MPEGAGHDWRDRLVPAARMLLEVSRKGIAERGLSHGVHRKSHGNFVTEADLQIEANLRARLGSLLPEAVFLGEETGAAGAAEGSSERLRWIVDPIDGTGNFLSGFDYATCVALESGGWLRFGLIYAPLEDRLYWALAAGGAYVLDDASRILEAEPVELPLRVLSSLSERLRIVPVPDAEEGVILFGMPYDRGKTHRILRIVEELYPMASDMKRIGPASLDICRVALSMAKLYVELDLQPWDCAAGALLLAEAGGRMATVGDLALFGSAETVDQARERLERAGLLP